MEENMETAMVVYRGLCRKSIGGLIAMWLMGYFGGIKKKMEVTLLLGMLWRLLYGHKRVM